ncbi:MAG: hypothetical protein ABIP48_13600 [Planctomycetota bacterium]
MDERVAADSSDQTLAADSAAVEESSGQYVGRWNRLVSTTNWEKGRIISEWRASLMEAGAPPQVHSDEAWSRRVGSNVSPQHVGRLRRVYEAFGEVYDQYPGLYWSHFLAASDWSDAEMWLEGAVESAWSVAQMRAQRWEATGAPADKKPKPEDVIAAEVDEDCDPALDEAVSTALGQLLDLAQPPPEDEAARDGAALDESAEAESLGRSQSPSPADAAPPAEPFRPFEDLPPLPADLAEALESFKLAILNHKLTGWREISRDQVLAALDALRQLALAPAEG